MSDSETGVPDAGRSSRSRLLAFPHLKPLLFLGALIFLYWSRVLVTGQVLLPGEMLSGFLPFGGNERAPWTILQWDSLAQYYPWRLHAARSLHAGQIPLWNPYQFTGTPFVANLQSAVFYPLNLPFWILDPAYAFGVSAFLHSVLASFATYFLLRRWGVGAAGACLAGLAYALCGYQAAWALLPTLAATAAWLPLCLLLLELAVSGRNPARYTVGLGVSLACALLAGHAQIFFYILLALTLRTFFLRRSWIRGIVLLELAFVGALFLGSIQLFPTLELARLGHRESKPPTATDWQFVQERALHLADLPSLALPGQPSAWGSLSENFGYVGIGLLLLAIAGLVRISSVPKARTTAWFAAALALFGLLYACATPIASFFFFFVPGISQMGGTGRVLLLWSFGIALLAGFGLDWLRTKVSSPVLLLLAFGFVFAELAANTLLVQPTSPRAAIYPDTTLTKWLQEHTDPKGRTLFLTPRKSWLFTEGFRPPRTHPPGVLPPNGATVYGIYDVNGYDSLSPRSYREYIGTAEEGGVAPSLNGNMVLLNNVQDADLLDTLAVRYVVTGPYDTVPNARVAYAADGCLVWERTIGNGTHVNGAAFYPGWKDGQYQPETFALGGFLSLTAILVCAFLFTITRRSRPEYSEPTP